MLREYRLTNFKAFGETVTIPIRPLTLIFGANSSGKSSIFQSLLLLKQTLKEAENPNTALLPKGSLVDLGTYRDFVHRHEMERDFEFEARFDLTPPLTYKTYKIQCPRAGLSVRFAYSTEKDRPEVFSGNLAVISDAGERQPIASYTTEFDEKYGERTAKIDTNPVIDTRLGWDFWKSWWDGLEHCYTKEDSEALSTLILLNFLWDEDFFSTRNEEAKNILTDLWQDRAEKLAEKCIQEFTSRRGYFGNFREFISGRDDEHMIIDSYSSYRNFLPRDFDQPGFSNLSRQPWQWINLPIGRTLSNFHVNLKNLVYIGPLRISPKRDYEFSGDTTDYVGQSGEYLPSILFKDQELVEQINSDLDRLGVKYQVKLSKFQDDEGSPSNIFALRLVDTETKTDASLRDVGFGIGQVLPIVAQSRLSEKKTLLIEQPEIHLHPAHQAELGDMFIRSALGEQKNTLLLETHSENLILRILRRIRETNDNELPEGFPPIGPEDVAILYVQPGENGAEVIEIPVTEDGDFASPWPQGFFEEREQDLF